MKNEQALIYLNRDVLLNIDMIETINRGNANIINASDKGVLLYNMPGNVYMMSTDDLKISEEMVDSIGQRAPVIAHQDFYIPMIQERFSSNHGSRCHNVMYTKREPLVVPNQNLEFKVLEESWLSFVRKYYTFVDSEEYVINRLASGVMIGAFLGDELAGFMGTHSEGAMGMLEILPEFRRKGIALSLESYYVNWLLEKGYIPYAQIVWDNNASLELHKKLNFEISAPNVSWVV